MERLLERINDGRLPEDRRAAVSELRDMVNDNALAQLALGSMGELSMLSKDGKNVENISVSGFPIMLQVLRDEREDLEMVKCS